MVFFCRHYIYNLAVSFSDIWGKFFLYHCGCRPPFKLRSSLSEHQQGRRRVSRGAPRRPAGVQARRDDAHLVILGPGDGHPLGHSLHFAGAGARGVHLGHGGHGGAVDASVAFEHVLTEEAAGARLGGAQRHPADAGGEAALSVAVAAVRSRSRTAGRPPRPSLRSRSAWRGA